MITPHVPHDYFEWIRARTFAIGQQTSREIELVNRAWRPRHTHVALAATANILKQNLVEAQRFCF